VIPSYNFEAAPAAEFLSLMANEKRLQILGLIIEREWDVGSLANEIGLSQSALSQHLKKLRDGNLVTVRREAQTLHYSCPSSAVMTTLGVLRDLFCERADLATAA
jgi:DNA-binding transcriptional ArsR family regulator